MFIWERPDWPQFRWDAAGLAPLLAGVHVKNGRLLGRMERLGFGLQRESELLALTEEAVKSAEIEGDIFDRASVRSSVAQRLGLPDAALGMEDRRIAGLVDMMLDATRNHSAALTPQRLFGWQAALFPDGYSGLRSIGRGAWRDDQHGPMQIVSGPIGRERVHFQAPPAERVAAEMQAFFDWFNAPQTIDGILHAALAHLWFVTIHPFEDGNGRIARAIADLSLARSAQTPHRFYSLSGQIRRQRAEYYTILEQAQTGDLDVTVALRWFAGCIGQAIDAAEIASADVLRKAMFWQRHAQAPLNDRQRKVLNRYLDGFEGKLTARKWAAIAKCSLPTAQRDIQELTEQQILVRGDGGSKHTAYMIAEP